MAVIDSVSNDNRKTKQDIIVFIDLGDRSNLAAVKVNINDAKINGEEINAHIIKSVYTANLKDEIERVQKNNKNIYYFDIKQAGKYLGSAQGAIPSSFPKKSSLLKSINDSDSNVKFDSVKRTDTKQFKRFFGDSVVVDGEKLYYIKAFVKRYRDSLLLVSLDSLYSVNSKTKGNTTWLKESGGKENPLVPYTDGVTEMSIKDFLENVKYDFDDVLPQKVLDHWGINRRKTHYTPYLNFDLDISDNAGYEESLSDGVVFTDSDSAMLGKEETLQEWQQRKEVRLYFIYAQVLCADKN